MKRTFFLVVAFSLIFLWIFIAANASEQCSEIIKSSFEKWQKVKDYTCTMYAYNRKGNEEDVRLYEYKFLKPNYVYMKVLEGRSKKAKVFYDPVKDKVKGCKKILWGYICKTFDPSDKKVTSIRGAKVYESSMGYILDEAKSLLPSGVACLVKDGDNFVVLEFSSSAPFEQDVSRLKVYIDKSMGLPVKWEKFAGELLVNKVELRDVKLNLGLTLKDLKP